MTENNTVAVAEQPRQSNLRVVENDNHVLDTAKFDHMWRIAKVMASGSLIPETLRTEGSKEHKVALPFEVVAANCFLVVNQAVRWGMDPFAVVGCCSVVHGRLMYEGKLVAAVLQAKSKVRLRYEYNDANGKALGIRVVGRLPGEEEERDIFGTVADWETSGNNSPWGKPGNWRRQLAYRGAREWARLHDPSALLGVYADDEFDEVEESRTQKAKTSPPLLTSSFPEQAKPAKAEKKAKAAPAKKEPEPESAQEAEIDHWDHISVQEFLERVEDPAANVPKLIDDVCFKGGNLVVDDEELAKIWIAASSRIAASLDEGLLQALSAFGRSKTVDEIDELALQLEGKIWFKSAVVGQKQLIRKTILAIRTFLDVQSQAHEVA
jgi:hypothetical protein